MQEPLLRIEGLKFAFGRTPVLNGLHLEVRRGENCLLWGLNGSGKTTLGKLIAGLLRPDAGRIIVNASGERAYVAMVLAEPDRMLLGDTVQEDARLGPENLGFEPREVEGLVRRALSDVNLWELRDRPTSELSTGERKRLAIAGALATGARLLILDEPFAFLDDQQVKRLLDVLRRITASGRSLLILSGQLHRPERYDRLFALNEGAVKDGRHSDIIRFIEGITSTDLNGRPAAKGR